MPSVAEPEENWVGEEWGVEGVRKKRETPR